MRDRFAVVRNLVVRSHCHHVTAALEGKPERRSNRHPRISWRRRGTERDQLPTLRVAARCVEPLVLRLGRHAWTVLRELRHGVEYVFNPRTLPRLPASMAVDIVPAMQSVVETRGVVRGSLTLAGAGRSHRLRCGVLGFASRSAGLASLAHNRLIERGW